jgi:hypothetical protein
MNYFFSRFLLLFDKYKKNEYYAITDSLYSWPCSELRDTFYTGCCIRHLMYTASVYMAPNAHCTLQVTTISRCADLWRNMYSCTSNAAFKALFSLVYRHS